MGRKRIKNKKSRITITTDAEILEQMKKLEINRSAFFTEKAAEFLQEFKKKENS